MSHYSRGISVLLFLAVILLSPTVFAVVMTEDFGRWPENWPKDLEPLAKKPARFALPAELRSTFTRFALATEALLSASGRYCPN